MWQRECAYQSGEATFWMSGKVNRHNVRICGRENMYIREHVQDPPKTKRFLGRKFCGSVRSFHFRRTNCNSISHLEMLENCLIPKLQQGIDRDFVFSTRWGTHAFPSRGSFLHQSRGGRSDWTWWNDSLATTITWFNIPLPGYVKVRIFVPPPFLQVWKNYGHG